MKLTIWSDYACPYCYIGEARLRKVLAGMAAGDEIEVELRAFELDPSFPTTVQSDTITRFGKKYHLPPAQAAAQVEHISELGRAEGIDFRYAEARYTNTFDAHRLMKLAQATGDKAVAERVNFGLFDAYFTKNQELAAPATLMAVGTAAGLDAAAIEKLLASDEYGAEVRADERAAAAQGVHGVPYFLFEDGTAIPGAVSAADLRLALQGALAGSVSSGGGHQCGPDGCVL